MTIRGRILRAGDVPYPSGRIHIGHVANYTLGDVLRATCGQGAQRNAPDGLDAFGLAAENGLSSAGRGPRPGLRQHRAMKKQLKSIGLSLDWSREFRPAIPLITAISKRCFWTSCGRADRTREAQDQLGPAI